MSVLADPVAAGLLAGAAVLLTRPVPPAAAGDGPVRTRRDGGAAAVLVVGVVVTAVLLRLPVVALAGGLLVAAGVLRRARRRARDAEARAGAVHEVCGLLASELTAGQPPEAALEAAARAWPPLGDVARTARLGGSVPASLRVVAGLPGAGDLRLVAAAWQVSQRSGAGLADALGAVEVSLRARAASARVVRAELASARSTARLVAALPLMTLAMGSGLGGAPVAFLLGTGPGLALCAAGLALGVAGLAWIDGIARGVAGGDP